VPVLPVLVSRRPRGFVAGTSSLSTVKARRADHDLAEVAFFFVRPLLLTLRLMCLARLWGEIGECATPLTAVALSCPSRCRCRALRVAVTRCCLVLLRQVCRTDSHPDFRLLVAEATPATRCQGWVWTHLLRRSGHGQYAVDELREYWRRSRLPLEQH